MFSVGSQPSVMMEKCPKLAKLPDAAPIDLTPSFTYAKQLTTNLYLYCGVYFVYTTVQAIGILI
jgi:hypothetical protein